MIRFLSLMGMGGGFLMISPSLRGTALQGLAWVMGKLDHYSPYSYVVVGVAFFGGAALSMRSKPRPR